MSAERWTCSVCSTQNEAAVPTCVVCHASPTDRDVPRVPTAKIVRGASAAPAPPIADANRVTMPPPPVTSGVAAEVDAPAPPPGRSASRYVLPALAAVLLAVVVGVGAAVMAGGGDSEESTDGGGTTAPVTTAPVTTAPVAGQGDEESDTGASADASTTTAATTTMPPARPGELFAGDAKVRDAPALAGVELLRITGESGLPLEIVEEATLERPWYRVRVRGVEGYVFGAFVLRPAPGLCVAAGNGTPPVYDTFGTPLPDEKSGDKVLITGPAQNGSHPVVLPGGARGFVSTGDVGPPQCG